MASDELICRINLLPYTNTRGFGVNSNECLQNWKNCSLKVLPDT